MTNQVRLEGLWRDHAPTLFGFAVRRTMSRDDAWDVVAEVYVVACRRIDDIPEGAAARLWLFGTARKVLSNQSRSKRRYRDLAERAAAESQQDSIPDGGPLDDVVRTALERLSPGDRELVLLTTWDGLDPSEVSALLALPPGTVRVRLHRARSRLRRHLADLGLATQIGDEDAPAIQGVNR